MDDFVRVGGLAAVSAALPRALRPWADIRVLLPGYADIVEQLTHIQIVGECAAKAEMPAARLGRASTRDGLPVYVLLCPQLYERPGNPYGDEEGRDWSRWEENPHWRRVWKIPPRRLRQPSGALF